MAVIATAEWDVWNPANPGDPPGEPFLIDATYDPQEDRLEIAWTNVPAGTVNMGIYWGDRGTIQAPIAEPEMQHLGNVPLANYPNGTGFGAGDFPRGHKIRFRVEAQN